MPFTKDGERKKGYMPQQNQSREQIAKREERLQKDSRQRVRDKRKAAGFDTGGAKQYKGPYMMKPGANSQVNPGNFKGSEVMKYSAFMYNSNPMKFEDQKGTSPGITKADVVSARKDGYNPKMYNAKMYNAKMYKNK